ncbi:MAG: amidohydrolase family protein [Planctomycetota bacterium]
MTGSWVYNMHLRAAETLVVALVSVMTAQPGAAQEDSIVAVKAGTIIPVTAEPIENGIILIRNGKIEAVGQAVEVPDGAEVIDASDKVVIPGLIDAFTTLAEQREDEESITPDIRAKDAFDFYGEYRRMLAGGVTTVYVSPGQQRLVGGVGAVVKLAGQPAAQRLLDDESALRVTLGELPKNPPAIFDPPIPPGPDNPLLPEEKQLPTTRMAELAVLRRVFTQARLDRKKHPEEIDPKTKVLIQTLNGRLPVRVNCHNVQDIRSAISFAKAYNLKLIIEGATEACRAVDQIKDCQAPVVLSGVVRPGRKDPRDYAWDVALGRINPASPAILAKADVKFAISAPTDETVADLQFVAGHAVTRGLSTEHALQAITVVPAEILGVADRVGSIEKGKDADLVILSDQPFSIQSVVDRTMVNGQTVYTRETDGRQQTSEQPTLAVRAGRILTASEGHIDNGLILVRDCRITYVGPPKEIPQGTTVLDATGSVVIPGMIDIHSHLGLHWESEPVRLDSRPATTGPKSDRLNLVSIVNAIAPNDEAFQKVMRRGVTSVLLAPATTGLVSGNAALIKTAGDGVEDVVVKEYAAVKFSMLGDGQRLARVWQARDLLKKAKEYAEKWDKYEREHQEYRHRQATAKESEIKEPDRPGRDAKLELLRGLFRRKMPAMVHANRADEILGALQVFREEYNLDVIILGGDDSFRIVPELKKHRARMAIGPEILRYEKGRAINSADLLIRNGLRVAFHTSATSGTQYLPEGAGYAVKYGMDRNKALRAITSYPAEMLKVDDRVGSIDVGKDADLVILSGEPFEFTSRVEKVIVSGRVAFDSNR